MQPIDFPEANRTFLKPASMTDDECAPLRVEDTGEAFVSVWKPTPEERQAIASGAPVVLWVFGRGHPPVALAAGKVPADAAARMDEVRLGTVE